MDDAAPHSVGSPMLLPLMLLPLLAAWAGGCALVGGEREEFHEPGVVVEDATPAEVGRVAIDGPGISRHAAFLESDALRGKDDPIQRLTRAAAWVAESFQLAGLDPAGDGGGYVQYWPAGDSARGPNVIGLLPGSDLTRADEYVVLTARLAVHGGAPEGARGPDASTDGERAAGGVTNTTGVAVLLEIADAFSALPTRPARPLLFLVVGARGDDADGARWFADHPTVALSSAVAALELELDGRTSGDTLRVVPHGGSGLVSRVTAVAEAASGLGLHVVDASGTAGGDGRPLLLDGTPALAPGTPALTVLDGDASRGNAQSRRRRWDPRKPVRVATLVFLTAHALASPGDGF